MQPPEQQQFMLFQSHDLKFLAQSNYNLLFEDIIWDVESSRLFLVEKRCQSREAYPPENCFIDFKVLFDRANPPYDEVESDQLEPVFTIGLFQKFPYLNWSRSRRYFTITNDQLQMWRSDGDDLEMLWAEPKARNAGWNADESQVILLRGEPDHVVSTIVDTTSGRTIMILENTFLRAWSPDGLFVSGNRQTSPEPSEFFVMDVQTGRFIFTSFQPVRIIWSVDGHKFAAVGQGVVSIWERS
jgi:hypothetical protein